MILSPGKPIFRQTAPKQIVGSDSGPYRREDKRLFCIAPLVRNEKSGNSADVIDKRRGAKGLRPDFGSDGNCRAASGRKPIWLTKRGTAHTIEGRLVDRPRDFMRACAVRLADSPRDRIEVGSKQRSWWSCARRTRKRFTSPTFQTLDVSLAPHELGRKSVTQPIIGKRRTNFSLGQ